MRIIKKKTLDDISKKLDFFEQGITKEEEEKLNQEEKEKLQRFGLYQTIRMEKHIRQGGDPDFANLDASEQTTEEFEYHLSHMLNDFIPEERYRQRKEMYYFHPSYVEMEKLDYWEDRANAKYCTGHQCIQECPYFEENGIIEDEQVIKDLLEGIQILEVEDYKKELGEELVQSIISNWNSS